MQTAVADTTSVAEVYEEGLRYKPDGDIFVRVLVERTLQSLIVENGLTAADGELYEQAMTAILAKEKLNVGDIVAIRGVRDGRGNPRRIVQLSLYTADTYIGTLARADDGRIVRAPTPGCATTSSISRAAGKSRSPAGSTGCSTRSTRPRRATRCRPASSARRSCCCRAASTSRPSPRPATS